MFVNDSLQPYLRLGAIDQESYTDWVEQRYAAQNSKIYSEHKGVRSLLKRKAADSLALSREIWELELISAETGDVKAHLLHVANKVRKDTIITCLCDANSTELLLALQGCGALVRGANVSWGFTKSILSSVDLAHESNSVLMTNDLRESFQACVRSSFSGYRSHYHTDNSLAPAASEVYISGICASVDSDTEAVVTLDSTNEVVAFTTIDPHEHKEVNSVLGANLVGGATDSGVSTGAQRGGWYAKNIRATLSRVLTNESNWYVFGTAANNFAIQKTWIKLGLYFPIRFAYRIHWIV